MLFKRNLRTFNLFALVNAFVDEFVFVGKINAFAWLYDCGTDAGGYLSVAELWYYNFFKVCYKAVDNLGCNFFSINLGSVSRKFIAT